MITMNPYLNFNGNSEEAFNFYKSVFGGDFSILQRFSDIPPSAEMPEIPKEVGNKIMHIALPIGKGNILMATDALESMGQKMTVGNNFSISLQVESKEEADKLYLGLSKGGKIEMPLADAFWGAYFGSFTDKFGIQWMINYEYKK
ncbi:MAG: VOC family protein [Candidatus Gracilibacteria bacterium]|nr:VOC family protein [Candidatus Gracilibacteria bacterium]